MYSQRFTYVAPKTDRIWPMMWSFLSDQCFITIAENARTAKSRYILSPIFKGFLGFFKDGDRLRVSGKK